MHYLDKPDTPGELLHFGVKGMHWGVRKDRKTAPTTLDKSERKEARQQIRKLTNKSIDSKYGNDPLERKITEDQYKKLSTKDHVIKKGQEIGRITKNKDEKLSDVSYVSYKPRDRNLYRAIMPVVNDKFKFGGDKKYKTHYEYTYKALETLKSPSEKERVDAFARLFDSPSITLKNGKMVSGREFMKSQYPKEVKTLTSQQLGLRFYNNFTENQFAKTPINTAYFDSLRKRGYNAVVDDNDRVHLSEAPLILLNPNGTIKKMSITKLSADDINNAQRNLKVE